MVSDEQLLKLKDKKLQQEAAKQKILSGSSQLPSITLQPRIDKPAVDLEAELSKLKDRRERSRSRSLSPTSKALKRASERQPKK